MTFACSRRNYLIGSRILTLAIASLLAVPLAAQQPSQPGSVRGRVHTSAGVPYVGIPVRLDATPYAATTDTLGAFLLVHVPPGVYTLVVSGAATIEQRRSVAVLAGRETAVDVVIADSLGPAQSLTPVVVTAPAEQPARGALPEVRGAYLYSGKKTEVVRLDSLHVNKTQDVTREILGRVPGLNVSESEGSGFPSNGIAFRGLNPTQSVEMNTRQDGVNIVADLYGYPETYYAPPSEAVVREELIRGSSSLQFGPQFGGVIDYVLRQGQLHTPPAFTLRETGGTLGTFGSYLSLAGGTDRLSYFSFVQYRSEEGWRPNSDLSEVSAAVRLRYESSPRLHFGFEYTLLRNRIHMPGGLTDSAFAADPDQSFRSRNWLASPWNIVAGTVDYALSPSAQLTSTLSGLLSQRYLVWRNEDGGPGAADSIDPVTLTYIPREVEWEYFSNITDETRLRVSYPLFGKTSTLATGFRVFGGTMHRQEGGPGTTGSDFDMTVTGPYGTDVHFGSDNVALFAENMFTLSPKLAITPGVRFEYLHSTADGHTDTTFVPQSKDRTFALAGIGMRYTVSSASDFYANITQAYRPIEYSFLTPFASVTRVDPNMRDPKGYNADIGWRGTAGRWGRFDLGLFYLLYRDRVGIVSGHDTTGDYTEFTNVATSVHKGAEVYVEIQPLVLFGGSSRRTTFRVFDALGYTHARYTDGPFSGNYVENAPEVVNRLGGSVGHGPWEASLQWSIVTRQFTDANNTVSSPDALVGVIPEYHVLDLSAHYELPHRTTLTAGINNLTDEHYFTIRTTEYPGPGIIPSIGRSGYLTFTVGL